MFDYYYVLYLAHFHGTRDYFECHEVLEERWKMDHPLDRESILVAFIQLAVALYHQRRKNNKGALRILQKGIQKFYKHENVIGQYGLNKKELFNLLHLLEENIKLKKSYQDINLPINSDKLTNQVISQCTKLGCTYPSKSNLEDTFLIHKHILRKK